MPTPLEDAFLAEAIQFNNEDVDFDLGKKMLLRHWIQQIIHNEKSQLTSITYIFCSDEYLHKINLEYLNHDTYTDIITFSLSETEIESDIFISIDRIRENATQFNTDFHTELYRVIIHGVLHLCGFRDKTDQEQELMTAKENEALNILEKLILSQ